MREPRVPSYANALLAPRDAGRYRPRALTCLYLLCQGSGNFVCFLDRLSRVSMSSGIFNEPMKVTKPTQAAPRILEMRQALYDRNSLMPERDHWNPAQRLANMRSNYENMLSELSTGGSARHSAGPATARLPRVPAGQKPWAKGSGSKSARQFHGKQLLPNARGAEPSDDEDAVDGMQVGNKGMVVAWARILSRLDTMSESGKVSPQQMAKLKRLADLQESLISRGMFARHSCDFEPSLKSRLQARTI
eukprot:2953183-Pleurochrysis_carterae.AAC.2